MRASNPYNVTEEDLKLQKARKKWKEKEALERRFKELEDRVYQLELKLTNKHAVGPL